VPEIEESCESCRYFQPAAHRMAHGECRRYPHSLAKLLTEWCGEYRRPGEMIPVFEPREAAPPLERVIP
jgi:hypothetical protein